MKRLFTFILLLFVFSSLSVAQEDSRAFSFQGYALDANGNALGSATINVQFSIYVVGKDAEYTEVHTIQTDAYGVFALGIGSRLPNQFKALRFDAKNYFLKVEVKRSTESVYNTISDAQLMAVPYARTAANGVPVGTVVAFAGPLANIPAGWLLCDGTSVSTTTYPHLFEAIQHSWGGSGTSFNLPDMRGMFLRGVAGAAAADPDKTGRVASNTGGNTGNNVGSKQTDAYKSHDHPATSVANGSHAHNTGIDIGQYGGSGSIQPVSSGGGNWGAKGTDVNGNHSHTINVSATGGTETRPINVYVYYIIKY